MINDLIFALGILIGLSVAVKMGCVGLHIMFNPDDKAEGFKQIKFLIVVLIISLVLTTGPTLLDTLLSYFQKVSVSPPSPPQQASIFIGG